MLAGLVSPTTPAEQPAYRVTRVGAVPSSTEVTTREHRKSQKVQKWSGSLVDANCVTNVLRQLPFIDPVILPDPLSRFLQIVESSRRAEQGRDSRTGSPQGQPLPPSESAMSTNSDGEPETSERELAAQAVQLRRAKMYEQVVKACTPNRPTTHFGLVVAGEQFLKFDTAGDFKAKEAIIAWAIEPGNTIKAKVKGVIAEADTVRVASIEINGRIPPRALLGPGGQ